MLLANDLGRLARHHRASLCIIALSARKPFERNRVGNNMKQRFTFPFRNGDARDKNRTRHEENDQRGIGSLQKSSGDHHITLW